jgi:diadenosine tetraphosphate (Ap4A) HIT family hydrolase
MWPLCGVFMSERISCKICEKVWPPSDHYIGDLGMTKAYVFEDQFFAGWTVLVLKDHRTELFQLTQDERRKLIEEVSRTGEALTKTFNVEKINSELLGNQVPHIHWHVIPRLKSDPDPLKPVWCVAHEPVHLRASLLSERILLLRSALGLSLPAA